MLFRVMAACHLNSTLCAALVWLTDLYNSYTCLSCPCRQLVQSSKHATNNIDWHGKPWYCMCIYQQKRKEKVYARRRVWKASDGPWRPYINTVCLYVRRRSAHNRPDAVTEIPAILHKNHLYLLAGRWHANGVRNGLGHSNLQAALL